MIIAGTGHRPEKIRIGPRDAYDQRVFQRVVDLSVAAIERERPALVIAGGALGFDEALARAAVRVGVPLELYLPFPGYDRLWPAPARARYQELHALAQQVLYVTPEDDMPRDLTTMDRVRPSRAQVVEMLHRRNRAMVDAAELLLALWDGGRSGGTWQCLRYAEFKRKPVRNVWAAWSRHAAQPPRTISRRPR